MARGPGRDQLADHSLAGTRPGRVQHQGVEIARFLAEDTFHPSLHDLHLRCTVQVLAGVPAGSGGAFNRQHGAGLADGVGQRGREQPGAGVEVRHHGTRCQEPAVVQEIL